ncbi:hypothetical protein D0U04_24125 [Bacillus clarus]|uniref:Uncharacterized protein n=1 Tax=Bacillus clarus TaxID=2338372 RepID=A0A090YZD2_9BACI|nr:hypothetical protein DJ93_3071 [Bacillus clarus]RFT63856.1 hypothetical protein D0U04_24125 [Bacillus clarus]
MGFLSLFKGKLRNRFYNISLTYRTLIEKKGEAVELSSFGRLVGKLLSVSTSMTISYSLPVAVLACLFLLLVGVCVFLANKASKLHPIQTRIYK